MVRLVIAAAALAVGSTAAAQTHSPTLPPSDYVIVSSPAPDATCTYRNARAVNLARVTAHPADYQGQCVSVYGHWAFRALFVEASDAERRYSNAASRSEGRRLGLYLSDADRTRTPGVPVRALAIGKVGDCSDLNGANVIMVMGYCHYTGGPYLNVPQIRALD